MKRDPRLRPLAERRDHAHGGKYGRTPRYRPTSTPVDFVASIARALHLPPELVAGPSAYDLMREREREFRRDAALYGACYVDGATGKRIPPETIIAEFGDVWP